MISGSIIGVEDVNTYVVKIPPDAQKERIGRLVKIENDDGIIVGVIKSITHRIREELIPYIEPDMLPKYAPFNKDFRQSYYIVHGLGTIRRGSVRYSIDSPPDIEDTIVPLSQDEIRRFHTINGKPSIAYFHTNWNMLDRNVLLCIADQVEDSYPECSAMLKLVRKYIEARK